MEGLEKNLCFQEILIYKHHQALVELVNRK